MTQQNQPLVRFGILGSDHGDVVEQALEAEALGFDLFALSDHLHSDRPTLEPWTALTWAAAATERITVLTDVLGLPYREPAVLAKMAETLDRLSDGRLILGLGNGGYEPEFRAFGLPTRTPGHKVAALGEAILIMRALWSGGPTSFDGRHFRLDAAQVEPSPERSIPLWIGAYGPRSLAQTGALADGWLPSMQRLDLDRAVTMRLAIDDAARAVDRDPAEIVAACNVQVGLDQPGTGSPQRLIGRPVEVAQQLIAMTEIGFRTFVVAGLDGRRDRERFAGDVVPLVRASVKDLIRDR